MELVQNEGQGSLYTNKMELGQNLYFRLSTKPCADRIAEMVLDGFERGLVLDFIGFVGANSSTNISKFGFSD